MNRTELIQKIEKILKNVTNIEDGVVIEEETSLLDDLELASLEIFSLIGEVESTFHITIPSRILTSIDTIGELTDQVIARISNTNK